MSIFKRAEWIACAVIFIMTAVVSIPLAEIGFRLIGDKPSLDLQGLYAPFGDGNYKNAPNVNTHAELASGHLSVYTDDLGLRCDEARTFASKPGDTVDIMLIGDSQGFGNGVNFEETIAGAMADLALKQGYRVCNASVGGHSLASQLELARWLVGEKGLKVNSFVLLLTPAMISNCDHLNRATVGSDGRLYGGVVDFKTRTRIWIKTHAVIYSRVRDAVRNLGIGADPTKGSPTVLGFYEIGAPPPALENRLLNEVQEFSQFAKSQGASLRLVYVPLTVEADFETVRRAAAQRNMTLDPNAPFDACTEVAKHLNTPCYDLRPILGKIKAEGHLLNVIGDFHYSSTLSKSCGVALWGDLDLPTTNKSMITSNGRK